MFTMLAILVYLAAMGVPILFLYRYGSQAWYWHTIAVVTAVAFGLMPAPLSWRTPGVTLLFGFFFVLLMVWGLGGIVLYLPRHAKRV
ncbi:MAG TPA: hypothetical protein VG675_12420 [Bryobacteraceae bacterium]|nr:hypothetical protein [Bryobacteraceae bacterium]